MTDKFSSETRSRVMRSIKSESKLENRVSKAIWKEGIRFRKNDKTLLGTPDISIKKYKIVIFIDSCFWHNCNIHGHIPKTNQEYWIKKLLKNIERDKKVSDYYQEKNWEILRIWEHQLKKNCFEITIKEIVEFVENVKANSNRGETNG